MFVRRTVNRLHSNLMLTGHCRLACIMNQRNFPQIVRRVENMEGSRVIHTEDSGEKSKDDGS